MINASRLSWIQSSISWWKRVVLLQIDPTTRANELRKLQDEAAGSLAATGYS